MVPVSLLLALAVGGLIGAFNGYLVVKVKMSAFIITLASYIWVRGLVLVDLGRPLGAGPCAGHPLVRHPAPARPAAHRLDRHRLFRRLLADHGQDAVRPAPGHDRRQRDRDLPRRHPRQPQPYHRLHSRRRHCRPRRLAAGDPHLRRHRQSRRRPAVQRLRGGRHRRRQPERRRRHPARRLCRRAAALGHQHGDQSHGPSGQLTPR